MSRTQKIIFTLTFALCLTVQVLPVIRSGLNYSFGIGFWGPNGHDGIWHLALINNIRSFKIPMPVFSGETLTNYHPAFDLLIAFLASITKIPTSIWLFQLYPLLSTVLFLWLSFLVGKKHGRQFATGIYLMCLNSFASSLGWLITLLRGEGIGGESLFWSMQSASNQINPPFLLSLILIFSLLLLLPVNRSKLSLQAYFFIFIILSLAPITKAYSAVVVYGIFGVYSLTSLINKNYRPTIFLIFSLISSFFLFRFYNPHSTSLLTFSPFWFSKSLVESYDRLYLPKVANQLHLPFGANIFDTIKLIVAYSISFTLFIIGNFAFRLLGISKMKPKKNWWHLSLTSIIIILVLIPTLFIQKGTSWNTIQFLYYALILSNIFLAQYLANHFKLALIILVVSFLSNYGNFQNSLGNPPPAFISPNELIALHKLKQLPPGTVLTFPYDNYLKNDFSHTPIPLYAYETTSYVSAYSQHPTFVDDYMNLNNSGYNYLPRLEASSQFFQQKDIHKDRGFLLNNNIDYIYLTDKQRQRTNLNIHDLYLKIVFENTTCTIYQVQK